MGVRGLSDRLEVNITEGNALQTVKSVLSEIQYQPGNRSFISFLQNFSNPLALIRKSLGT